MKLWYENNNFNLQKILKIILLALITISILFLKVNALNNNKIMAEITGEINNPGIYELEQGKKVSDLINLAGGLTSDANSESVQWARILSNGDKITIYKSDIKIMANSDNGKYDRVYNNRYNNFYYNYKHTFDEQFTNAYKQSTNREVKYVDVIENPGSCEIKTPTEGARISLNSPTLTANELYYGLMYNVSDFSLEQANGIISYKVSKGSDIISICELFGIEGLTYEQLVEMSLHVKV